MAANSLVQTRIESEVKEKASTILEKMGLTVSDAVRFLLTRIANEGGLPPGLTAAPRDYDAWFRAKVQEALNDPHLAVSDDEAKARPGARKKALRVKTT